MERTFLGSLVLSIFASVAIANFYVVPASANDVGFYINRGVQKQRNNDQNGAIADFNQAIRVKPVWEAYYNRALSQLALGHQEAALSDYFEAIKFDPKDPEVYYRTGTLLLDPNFRTRGENAELAERYMTLSINGGFRPAYSYMHRGLARYAQDKYTAAQSDCTEAIRLDPSVADAWHIRGNSKSKLQEYASALADLQKAYALNPNKAHYLIALVETKTALRDFQGAIELTDKVLRTQPNNAICLQLRGSVKEKKGDKQGALADYSKAIAADPKYSDARWARGELRSSMNDFNGAIEDFNESIRILNGAPVASLSYYGRGYVRYKQRDFAQAIQDFAKADSLANMDENFYGIFGETLINGNRPTEGIKYLEKALSMVPNNGVSHFNLGVAHYKLGRFGTAGKAYAQAASFGQTPFLSTINAANCFRRQGMFDEAQKMLDKAKTLKNDDTELAKKLDIYITRTQQRDSSPCEWEDNKTGSIQSSINVSTGTEPSTMPAGQKLGGAYLTAAELRNGTVGRARAEITELFPQTFQIVWFFSGSRPRVVGNGIRYGDKFVIASMDRAVLWVGIYQQEDSRIVGATTNTNYARGTVLTEVLSRTRPSDTLPRMPAADRDITGTYKVDGRYGPHKYDGEITFERDGQTYNVHWRTKEGMHLQGIAIVSGNDIGVCYRTVGFAAPVIYRIRQDGSIEGVGTPNGKRVNLEVGVKIK